MPSNASGQSPGHVLSLTTLDPYAPLDDLEPLREIVGDARVVAVGENAHFVHEYNLARQRILRFLAERCGFTIFAFEFGFSEGFALDPWVGGQGGEADLAKISETAATWGAGDLLGFIRRYNTTAGRPVRFAGIDVPEAGGSLLPALLPVLEYLRQVDTDMLPLAQSAVDIAEGFAAGSAVSAVPAWASLGADRQDALTAALSRLRLRFHALEPLLVARSDQYRYDTALWRLEAAVRTDYMFRAMAGLFGGAVLPADLSIRDLYMAESVRWHLAHAEPGARIVLAAHNNHLQKQPVVFDGQLTSLPMGQHLHRMLGQDYFALALTSTADRTVEMYPDPNAALGFTIAETPIASPGPGSVEAAALDAGIELGLVDLRRAGRDSPFRDLTRIRTQSATLDVPVADAFDGLLITPTVTMQEGIGT